MKLAALPSRSGQFREAQLRSVGVIDHLPLWPKSRVPICEPLPRLKEHPHYVSRLSHPTEDHAPAKRREGLQPNALYRFALRNPRRGIQRNRPISTVNATLLYGPLKPFQDCIIERLRMFINEKLHPLKAAPLSNRLWASHFHPPLTRLSVQCVLHDRFWGNCIRAAPSKWADTSYRKADQRRIGSVTEHAVCKRNANAAFR